MLHELQLCSSKLSLQTSRKSILKKLENAHKDASIINLGIPCICLCWIWCRIQRLHTAGRVAASTPRHLARSGSLRVVHGGKDHQVCQSLLFPSCCAKRSTQTLLS